MVCLYSWAAISEGGPPKSPQIQDSQAILLVQLGLKMPQCSKLATKERRGSDAGPLQWLLVGMIYIYILYIYDHIWISMDHEFAWDSCPLSVWSPVGLLELRGSRNQQKQNYSIYCYGKMQRSKISE